MQILLINPNTSQTTTECMAIQARACLPDGVQLLTTTASKGAAMITDAAGLTLAASEVLRLGLDFVRAAQARPACGSDMAIVVGAFGNPGLALLRQTISMNLPVDVPVFGFGEAAMLEAASGHDGQPRRFGIATTTPGLQASIAESALALGLEARFTGTRIAAGQPLALAAKPELQRERLACAVAQCIAQDGAQAVVIGGGPLAQVALELAPRFAVPVISPVAAAMRAVLAAFSAKRYG